MVSMDLKGIGGSSIGDNYGMEGSLNLIGTGKDQNKTELRSYLGLTSRNGKNLLGTGTS